MLAVFPPEARGLTASLASFPDREPLETSLSLGAQALEHAADHLFALSDACVSPVKPFAAFTLARGVLESAATALWVFDSDIEKKERVERGDVAATHWARGSRESCPGRVLLARTPMKSPGRSQAASKT